jgi:hypothetical protein
MVSAELLYVLLDRTINGSLGTFFGRLQPPHRTIPFNSRKLTLKKKFINLLKSAVIKLPTHPSAFLKISVLTQPGVQRVDRNSAPLQSLRKFFGEQDDGQFGMRVNLDVSVVLVQLV